MDNYYIKVKNDTGNVKKIKLFDESVYSLHDKEEKIIGKYSDDKKINIFNLLKNGLIVSKILFENIKDEWLIKNNVTLNNQITDNKNVNEIPKKKRGRPKKTK